MRFAVLALAACALAPAANAQPQTVLFPGLEGQPLLDAVRAAYTPTRTLGYDAARDALFAYEQQTDGALTCVYTGFAVTLTPGADPSADAYAKGINTEHTWPQSWGASVEPSRSDLHHLFPTRDNVNSVRGNHPFAEIPDAQADGWYRLAAAQSNVPAAGLDEWSEKDNETLAPGFTGRFEPREDHAGDAARAVFYYRALYPDRVAAAGASAFFETQRADLLAWQRTDPVGTEEYARSEWIAARQGKPNPFVLDSTLARRAFGQPGGGTGEPGPSPFAWINEFHYDNDGADTGEFVEVAVPEGTERAAIQLTLYNGSGGAAYGTFAGTAFTPGQTTGGITLYALTLPSNGLQNGPPDGFALAVEGELVQFLSYEGVFTATDGPAAGLASTNVGVSETATTPLGRALALQGTGAAYTDFAWNGPIPATPGQPNGGQTFTAQPPPPVPTYTVFRPAAGEQWALGGRYVVKWNGPGVPELTDFVRVYLRSAAGTRTQVVRIKNKGKATVTVPATGLPPGEYEVVVEREADPTRFGVSARFTVFDPAGFAARTADVPTEFALEGAYPNPFNPATTVRFAVPTEGRVSVEVFDVLGRRVATLVDGSLAPGLHAVRWDAGTLGSGVYVVRMRADGFTQVQRITLLR